MTLFARRLAGRLRSFPEDEVVSVDDASVAELVGRLRRPAVFAKVLAVSMGIQVVAAVGNQIFFRAVGYEIPVLVNLLVLPVFFFLFLLAISFGSLGIREEPYILIYGMFGVPAEVALVMSFLNVGGLVLNYAIGAILIYTVRPKWGESDAVE